MAASRDCRTQTALAKKSGLAQSTIGRILRGEVNPQTGTMTFLTDALRVPLTTVVERAMNVNWRNVDNAMFRVLECQRDRKRAENALLSLRRMEDNAVERLRALVLGHCISEEPAPEARGRSPLETLERRGED